MSASPVISDSAFAAGIRFERLCGSLETTGYVTRLRQAALEALGEGWSARYMGVRDLWVIEHKSGRVRVTIDDDGCFTVFEFDCYGFEEAEVEFRGMNRRIYGPRALRFASELVAEIGR